MWENESGKVWRAGYYMSIKHADKHIPKNDTQETSDCLWKDNFEERGQRESS